MFVMKALDIIRHDQTLSTRAAQMSYETIVWHKCFKAALQCHAAWALLPDRPAAGLLHFVCVTCDIQQLWLSCGQCKLCSCFVGFVLHVCTGGWPASARRYGFS